jgi:hypothetical protein
MKDRARAARRMLQVQKQLHRLEELKYALIQQRLARTEQEQLELSQALSEDGALHSLFIDMSARRLTALRQEAGRLAAEREEHARSLLAHAGRLRNAERLAAELELELRRDGERAELEEVLEVALASDASLKQDR